MVAHGTALPVPDASAAQITMMQNLKTQALPRRRPTSTQPHRHASVARRQAASASFTGLAGLKPSLRDAAISMVSPVPGVAALTRRAVFDLELTKARQTDLFASLRGLDDAGKNCVDRLLGSGDVQTRSRRHVIDQFRSFQFARPPR